MFTLSQISAWFRLFLIMVLFWGSYQLWQVDYSSFGSSFLEGSKAVFQVLIRAIVPFLYLVAFVWITGLIISMVSSGWLKTVAQFIAGFFGFLHLIQTLPYMFAGAERDIVSVLISAFILPVFIFGLICLFITSGDFVAALRKGLSVYLGFFVQIIAFFKAILISPWVTNPVMASIKKYMGKGGG